MSKNKIQLHNNIYLEWADDQQTKATVHCYTYLDELENKQTYTSFSIKKESPNHRGSGYYYAYKRIKGKLHKLYVGTEPTDGNALLSVLEKLNEEGITFKTPKKLPNELPNLTLTATEDCNVNKEDLLKLLNELPNELPNELLNELPNESSNELPDKLPNKLPSKDEAIAKAIELYNSKPKRSDKSAKDSLTELINFIYQSEDQINF